uniref:Amidohydrolase-related domain-containing protein n=1 Tax=Acrobeloides nanus TaxID=290746 RepID=A0A914CEJ5_9BILA
MFKNPLVPAGLIATVGCLGGLILGSTFSGPHRTAVWAGRRVIAQDKLLSNIQIKIGTDGHIEAIGECLAEQSQVIHFRNTVLLPGFINAHSHAFHRFLRGRSEIGNTGADTFWKWRDNMYKLVEDVTYEQLKTFCKTTFDEMLMAGITTVGEFHYIHHGNGRFDLDEAVIDAAAASGIRLVLIETLYCRSGFAATDVLPEQRRFQANVNEFLAKIDVLEAHSKSNENVTIAVAAHSLRAVDRSSLQKLWNMTNQKKLAFHIHLEEQPKEVEDCIEVEGTRPSQFLRANLPINERLTAVHCTYTKREELDELAKAGVNICVCPTTEGKF